MVDYVAIGRRIRKYRKDKQMTQAMLAECLNLSVGYIGQIECGVSHVSLSRLYEIADVLNIDVAQLVSDGSRFEDFQFISEIDERIKDWSSENKELLMGFVTLMERKMKSN